MDWAMSSFRSCWMSCRRTRTTCCRLKSIRWTSIPRRSTPRRWRLPSFRWRMSRKIPRNSSWSRCSILHSWNCRTLRTRRHCRCCLIRFRLKSSCRWTWILKIRSRWSWTQTRKLWSRWTRWYRLSRCLRLWRHLLPPRCRWIQNHRLRRFHLHRLHRLRGLRHRRFHRLRCRWRPHPLLRSDLKLFAAPSRHAQGAAVAWQ